jgi:hypothetical protein
MPTTTITTELPGIPSIVQRCPWCFQRVSVSVVGPGAALAGEAAVAACPECGHAYGYFLLGRLQRVPPAGVETLTAELATMLGKMHRARCGGQCKDEDVLLVGDSGVVGEC